MFELLLVLIVAVTFVIGILIAIVRFIVGLFSLGSEARTTSYRSVPPTYVPPMGAPPRSDELSQLAELRRKQSELRVSQAQQMLIDAGINPFK